MQQGIKNTVVDAQKPIFFFCLLAVKKQARQEKKCKSYQKYFNFALCVDKFPPWLERYCTVNSTHVPYRLTTIVIASFAHQSQKKVENAKVAIADFLKLFERGKKLFRTWDR